MSNATPSLTLELLRRFSPLDFLTLQYQQQLLDSLQYVQRKAGSTLFQRGERSLALYYLLQGSLWLGEEGNRRTLQAGSLEACHALNEVQPQQESIGALTDVTLFALERGLLERLLGWSQSAEYKVISLHAGSDEGDEQDDWLAKLLRTPLFGRLPPSHLHTLLARFEFIEVAAGETVVRYGEPGEHFYVLKQGHAAVTLPASYRLEPRQELQSGDFFGEEALVSGAVRAATVTMLEAGVLARLERSLFIELIRPALIPQISPLQLNQLLSKGNRQFLLLDVRLPPEYRLAHQPGSVSLPVANLRTHAASLDRNTLYAVTPEGGIRSELAVHLLNQLGFEAYLLTESPGQPPVAA